MKIFCISQARMGSTRLPDKVLKKIHGKPLLEYHALRIAQTTKVDLHIIATTDLPQDKAIVDFCKQQHLNFYCGDANNVLSRYYHTAKAYNVKPTDLIIRVTSDCPIIAPELIDSLIEQHIANNAKHINDAISNIDTSSYPRGFDAEIFSMKALTNAYRNADTDFQLEHVTPYLYQHAMEEQLLSINRPMGDKSGQQSLSLRLCVDEENDFILMEQIVKKFPGNIIKASAIDIINFLQQHPEIAKINQDVQQKTH